MVHVGHQDLEWCLSITEEWTWEGPEDHPEGASGVGDRTDSLVLPDIWKGDHGQGLDRGQDLGRGHGLVQGQDRGQGHILDHHHWTGEEKDGRQKGGEGITDQGTVFSLNIPAVLKFRETFLFLFSTKMLIIRAGIHKMLVRIANSRDPDQTASAEAVWSGSTPFV